MPGTISFHRLYGRIQFFGCDRSPCWRKTSSPLRRPDNQQQSAPASGEWRKADDPRRQAYRRLKHLRPPRPSAGRGHAGPWHRSAQLPWTRIILRVHRRLPTRTKRPTRLKRLTRLRPLTRAEAPYPNQVSYPSQAPYPGQQYPYPGTYPHPSGYPPAAYPDRGPVPAKLTLKPGTFITVRLNQGLSSDRNQTGDAFSATLANLWW